MTLEAVNSSLGPTRNKHTRGPNEFKDLWALIAFLVVLTAYLGLSGYALYELGHNLYSETSFTGGEMSEVQMAWNSHTTWVFVAVLGLAVGLSLLVLAVSVEPPLIGNAYIHFQVVHFAPQVLLCLAPAFYILAVIAAIGGQ